MPRFQLLILLWILALTTRLAAADPTTQPTTQSGGKLPHIQIDAAKKTVRVDCESVRADYPLEFLTVVTGTNEYEALGRSAVKPSDLHLALLMVGLTPGQPIHFSREDNTWHPPTGPSVEIRFEYMKDGKTVNVSPCHWMRDVKTHQEALPMTWVFTGSKMIDQRYAADLTGCLVGVINNELSVLDVPAIKSRALEARQYERNPDTMPPPGTPFTMILTPAPDDQSASTRPANGPATRATSRAVPSR